jgi:hypothetical protein
MAVCRGFSKRDFVAYPNPTTDMISVSFQTVLIRDGCFYTTLGKKVLERSISSTSSTFSLKSLSNGIYFIKSKGAFLRAENNKTIIYNLLDE